MPTGSGEHVRRRRRIWGHLQASDHRRPVSGPLDRVDELAIAPVHLADQDGLGTAEGLSHAVDDLDLVSLGVDLHDVGREAGPLLEKIVD